MTEQNWFFWVDWRAVSAVVFCFSLDRLKWNFCGQKMRNERGIFTEKSSRRKQRKTERKLCERERAKVERKREEKCCERVKWNGKKKSSKPSNKQAVFCVYSGHMLSAEVKESRKQKVIGQQLTKLKDSRKISGKTAANNRDAARRIGGNVEMVKWVITQRINKCSWVKQGNSDHF